VAYVLAALLVIGVNYSMFGFVTWFYGDENGKLRWRAFLLWWKYWL